MFNDSILELSDSVCVLDHDVIQLSILMKLFLNHSELASAVVIAESSLTLTGGGYEFI